MTPLNISYLFLFVCCVISVLVIYACLVVSSKAVRPQARTYDAFLMQRQIAKLRRAAGEYTPPPTACTGNCNQGRNCICMSASELLSITPANGSDAARHDFFQPLGTPLTRCPFTAGSEQAGVWQLAYERTMRTIIDIARAKS